MASVSNPYCLVSDVLQILILAQQKCDHSLVDVNYTSSISLLPSFYLEHAIKKNKSKNKFEFSWCFIKIVLSLCRQQNSATGGVLLKEFTSYVGVAFNVIHTTLAIPI